MIQSNAPTFCQASYQASLYSARSCSFPSTFCHTTTIPQTHWTTSIPPFTHRNIFSDPYHVVPRHVSDLRNCSSWTSRIGAHFVLCHRAYCMIPHLNVGHQKTKKSTSSRSMQTTTSSVMSSMTSPSSTIPVTTTSTSSSSSHIASKTAVPGESFSLPPTK